LDFDMNSEAFDQWLKSAARRALVMGIINLTPDSFSDGGRLGGVEAAVEYAEEMVKAGADWLDVGGESTRPGALPVAPAEQIRRTIGTIAEIRGRTDTVISIDTTSAEVARAALDAGANVVNDISAGRDDPTMLDLVAERGAAVILMHMQGTPQTMHLSPVYADVTAEVSAFLLERRERAVQAGIDRVKILLDPGIGFGKNMEHDLRLIRDTSALAGLGQPLVVGPSRKRFIGQITGEERADRRVFGTAGVVAWCVANGTAVVRVHDVGPISQVMRMIEAISSEKKTRIS
jgi:dihydropteroate synthase